MRIVIEVIKDTFEVTYTPQGMADLLNRIGFSYKKTTEVPCEADPLKQKLFAEALSKILQEKEGMWCILPMVFILHTTAVPLMLG